MNVAYLDPPYSRYFHELASRLVELSGGSVVALLSCPAYRSYVAGDHALVWPPGQPERVHALPSSFEHAGWAQQDSPGFRRAFSHAVEWLKASFAAERIDVCLVFSDARPFSQAAQRAAEALGVVCVYFERGAFRLRTASLSTQGLNARFDLNRACRSRRLAAFTAHELPARRAVEPWLKLRFARFLLQNELGAVRDPQRRQMQHKRYHVFNYLRIAFKQFRAEHPDLELPHELPDQPVDPLRRTVLLPLQLPTDSQFVMHSPFPNNQALIDFVVPKVTDAMPGGLVLVKKHPMDVRSYRLPAGAREVDGNLARFYRQAAFVVCLNSTVGFEAAIRGKRVLCFGDSFYTSAPPVIRVAKDDFAEHVHALTADPSDDPEAGRALRAAVLRCYQSPGDVWAYTDADLDATAAIVMQQVGAALELEPAVPVTPAGRASPERGAQLPLGNDAGVPARAHLHAVSVRASRR